LILTWGKPTGGTRLTPRVCRCPGPPASKNAGIPDRAKAFLRALLGRREG
jgi:hypothetical protein